MASPRIGLMSGRLPRIRRVRPDELGWRVRTITRTQLQRLAARGRRPEWDRRRLAAALASGAIDASLRRAIDAKDWQTVDQSLLRRLQERPSRFVLDHRSADTLAAHIRRRWPDAASDAASRADGVLAGEYDVLGYRRLRFSPPGVDVDWHFDPVHRRGAPARFWADVPYLDSSIGDHKIIWELNRHQHWLQLGRAWWLTGDRRYADGIVDRLASWLSANPPLTGINWASMLEIGMRAMSWTWALHFLLAPIGTHAHGGIAPRARTATLPWLADMLIALDRQLTHLEQNLSYYFSPNTHLTGEALALYVVGVALPELAGSQRWTALGRDILINEIDRQILPDGGHAERSAHYHRYTLDIYLMALLTAVRDGDDAAVSRFTGAAASLADFARAIADGKGRLPLIGDDDGGMLWPIAGRACDDVRDSLALAALALGRADLAVSAELAEEAFWVGGATAIANADRIEAAPEVHRRGDAAHVPAPPAPLLTSRTFPHTGYVVARDRSGGHAVLDVGRHGYMNGGHAHADALSLTLTLNHRSLLIDAGTSTYTMDLARRDWFRESASHNTVTIDGRSQSIPDGPFHWRTQAHARLTGSRHNPAFDWAEASHDGYQPLEHRRSLVRTASGWLIVDRILGSGRHRASAHWLFDPAWTVAEDGTGRIRAVRTDGSVAWLLYDPGTAALRMGEAGGAGWCAPVYGTLIPTWAVRVTCEETAPFDLVTWIGDAPGDHAPTLERPARLGHSAGDAIAARLTIGDRVAEWLLQTGDRRDKDGLRAETSRYRTDARVIHHAAQGRSIVELDLVDATEAHAVDGALSVAVSERIADLHLALHDGIVDLGASRPPCQVRLSGAALPGVRGIRLNGREVDIARADRDEVTVDGGQWIETPLGVG